MLLSSWLRWSPTYSSRSNQNWSRPSMSSNRKSTSPTLMNWKSSRLTLKCRSSRMFHFWTNSTMRRLSWRFSLWTSTPFPQRRWPRYRSPSQCLVRQSRPPRLRHLGRWYCRSSRGRIRSWHRHLRQARSTLRPGSERSRCSRSRSSRSRRRRYQRPPSQSRRTAPGLVRCEITPPVDNRLARPMLRLPQASEPRIS